MLKGNAPVLLFFGYCLFSVMWSDYPDVAFKRWTKGFGDLEMGLIVLTESDPLAALKRLLTRAGFVLIPLSVLYHQVLSRLSAASTIVGHGRRPMWA